MTYGYARVSTVKQKKDGNNLEEQMEKLKEFGCNDIIVEAYTWPTRTTSMLSATAESH